MDQQNSDQPSHSNGVHSPDKGLRIAIVGGGVFGISSALHLARRGYTNVTVFDRDEIEKTNYSVKSGCTGASADENKVIRASYGTAKLYEELAFRALDEWTQWNSDIASSSTFPPGMTSADLVWNNCGFLRAAAEDGLDVHEQSTQNSLPDHLKSTQYRVTDEQRIKDAEKLHVASAKLDPYERKKRGLLFDGILDSTGGFVRASLACTWALHRCRELGVKFKLGKDAKVTELLRNGGKVEGLKTIDGESYQADLVIVAGGGWTPALLPECSQILETTAGSLVTIKIPDDRPDLLKKFSPEQFPTWSWKMDNFKGSGTEVGGIYGFPRDPEGRVKIGFRGTKFTHFTNHFDASGRAISFPTTEKSGIPKTAMKSIRAFCEENLPDLAALPIHTTRLCWYTDAVDSSFLIDWVPGTSGLMVASGGSGHGFKFLPVLGEKVVDRVEGRVTPYSDLFAWRSVPQEVLSGPDQGPEGQRTLEKQDLATHWNF